MSWRRRAAWFLASAVAVGLVIKLWEPAYNYAGQPVSLIGAWMIAALYAALHWRFVRSTPCQRTGLLAWLNEPTLEPTPAPTAPQPVTGARHRPTPHPRPAVAIAAPPLSLGDRYQAEQDQQYAEALAAIQRIATQPVGTT